MQVARLAFLLSLVFLVFARVNSQQTSATLPRDAADHGTRPKNNRLDGSEPALRSIRDRNCDHGRRTLESRGGKRFGNVSPLGLTFRWK